MEVPIEEVQQTGRQISEALVAQRPGRRPLDFRLEIEGIGNLMRTVVLVIVPGLKLRFAEVLDVVGENGIALRKIRKSSRRPDLVTLENSRIALDRLHQRAGLGLFGS